MGNEKIRTEVLAETRSMTEPLKMLVERITEAFGEIEGAKAQSVLILLDAIRWNLVGVNHALNNKKEDDNESS